MEEQIPKSLEDITEEDFARDEATIQELQKEMEDLKDIILESARSRASSNKEKIRSLTQQVEEARQQARVLRSAEKDRRREPLKSEWPFVHEVPVKESPFLDKEADNQSRMIGRVSLAGMETFKGGRQSVLDWTLRFERIAHVQRWDDETKMRALLALLEGPAIDWSLGSNVADECHTYAEVRERLIRGHLGSQYKEKLLREYHQCTWNKSAETISDYGYRLMKISNQLRLLGRAKEDEEKIYDFAPGLQKHIFRKSNFTNSSITSYLGRSHPESQRGQ